jgi:hypothetical protein
VKDSIGCGSSAAKTLQVFQIASMDLGAGSNEGAGPLIAARETEHLVAGVDQFTDCGRTNKACRACDEDTHRSNSFHWRVIFETDIDETLRLN